MQRWLTQKVKTKIRNDKKLKYWTVEDWKKVLFSEESNFCSRETQQSCQDQEGWALSSLVLPYQWGRKHPQNKIFWICFSFSDIGSLTQMEVMMNLYEHTNVNERKVIPDMWRAFPDYGKNFQHGYFPCLSSKKWTGFSGNKSNVLDCSGNSSDLKPKPIEKLWSVIKWRLQNLPCTTMTKLIDARDDWILVFHYPILSCF